MSSQRCTDRTPVATSASPLPSTEQDLAGLKSLTLKARCDDGFVAFLNGVEVASINRPATWPGTAPAQTGRTPRTLWTSPYPIALSALRAGTNILAVHALNEDMDDLDFLFSAELIGKQCHQHRSGGFTLCHSLHRPVDAPGQCLVKARVLGDSVECP